jgi:type VI secretion system protein ImpK
VPPVTESETRTRAHPGSERSSVRTTHRRGILETIFFRPGSTAPAPSKQRVRLVDLCTPWLNLIVGLSRMGQLPDPAAVRARALELKAKLDKSADEAGIAPVDREAAVFALVALTDETVLNTKGPARDVWIARPLQLELFGQNVAGEEFYTRLEGYRREREVRIEALEVCYCCLAFGFMGKLRLAGTERLRSLLLEVERDIAAVRGPAERRPLAPHAARHEERSEVVARRMSFWVPIGTFFAVLVLMFLVFKGCAYQDASRTAEDINQMLSR